MSTVYMQQESLIIMFVMVSRNNKNYVFLSYFTNNSCSHKKVTGYNLLHLYTDFKLFPLLNILVLSLQYYLLNCSLRKFVLRCCQENCKHIVSLLVKELFHQVYKLRVCIRGCVNENYHNPLAWNLCTTSPEYVRSFKMI